MHRTFAGGCHYLHYLHHSLASGEITGRKHSLTHQQKIVLKMYWAWPHPSEKEPVFPTVSFPHQEASISLLSLSIRGQTKWKPQSQKTNQTDNLDHSLVELNKLSAIPCRATQDRWNHGGESWQNMVHWRRECQTTSAFLPWEPHEQSEKVKRYDTERWTPQAGRCPICYWRRAEKSS